MEDPTRFVTKCAEMALYETQSKDPTRLVTKGGGSDAFCDKRWGGGA